MATPKTEKTMIQKSSAHLGNHALYLLKLPEAARRELFTFYEFLIFKYQAQADTGRSKKQRIYPVFSRKREVSCRINIRLIVRSFVPIFENLA
ncbi:MAG: hypothetical protein D3908_06600 [Candidatus Electrothrix sp. AUS4]|nr:hypothetical protein [Candidatus Electrothrix sp. AUS4]